MLSLNDAKLSWASLENRWWAHTLAIFFFLRLAQASAIYELYLF